MHQERLIATLFVLIVVLGLGVAIYAINENVIVQKVTEDYAMTSIAEKPPATTGTTSGGGGGGGITKTTTKPVISSISVSNINDISATITWTTDQPATTQVLYGMTSGYGLYSPFVSTLTRDHSVTLTGLSAKTIYHFIAQSRFQQGNTLTTSADQALTTLAGTTVVNPPPAGDTAAPSAPSSLNGNAVSASQINLSWSVSTDNVGVAGYKVYRGGSQIGTTQNLSFSDTGLSASTAYTYTVAAYDTAGNTSAQSASKSVTTQASTVTPPPTGGTTTTTTTPPTGSGPVGTSVTTCGILNQSGATYVLQNDVSSPGTCFSVQNDNITLDLNGKTVRYGSGGGTAPRFGVVGFECWSPGAANTDNPCGGPFRNFTVKNGSITQDVNASPFSHAVRAGQGNAGGNWTANNLTITVSAASAVGIYTAYQGGLRAFNNTIYSNVQTIASRHQIDGTSIKIDNGTGLAAGEIYNNTIIGGPQGGIYSTAAGTKIYGNTIKLKSHYTNDFCIYAWASNMDVYGNTCNSIEGDNSSRGIQLAYGSGIKVHDNIIRTRELERNEEYNGCEIGGTYGIQIEEGTTNAQVYNNDIKAYAPGPTNCYATALRATNLVSGANNIAYNNHLEAIRVGSTDAEVASISLGGDVTGGLTIENNDLISDNTSFFDYWDANSNIIMRANRYFPGSNVTPLGWSLAYAKGQSGSFVGHIFEDPIFNAGTNDSFRGTLLGAYPQGSMIEMFIRWTNTIQVVNTGGSPIAGASVVITDKNGAQAFSGATDGTGKVVAKLNQKRLYNTVTLPNTTEDLNPYTVNVTASGYTAKVVNLISDSVKTTAVTLTQ